MATLLAREAILNQQCAAPSGSHHDLSLVYRLGLDSCMASCYMIVASFPGLLIMSVHSHHDGASSCSIHRCWLVSYCMCYQIIIKSSNNYYNDTKNEMNTKIVYTNIVHVTNV